MTAATPDTALALPLGGVCLRACGWGLVACVALISVLALTVTLLPEGVLPQGCWQAVLLGFGVAAVTGCIGTSVQAWLSTTPAGHPQVLQRYLAGMVGNFLLQAAAAVGGCCLMVAFETKFAVMVAFGLSFAAAATTLHIAGVVVVSRALGERAARSELRNAGTPEPQPSR